MLYTLSSISSFCDSCFLSSSFDQFRKGLEYLIRETALFLSSFLDLRYSFLIFFLSLNFCSFHICWEYSHIFVVFFIQMFWCFPDWVVSFLLLFLFCFIHNNYYALLLLLLLLLLFFFIFIQTKSYWWFSSMIYDLFTNHSHLLAKSKILRSFILIYQFPFLIFLIYLHNIKGLYQFWSGYVYATWMLFYTPYLGTCACIDLYMWPLIWHYYI